MHLLRLLSASLVVLGLAAAEPDPKQLTAALDVLARLRTAEFAQQKAMVVYDPAAPDGYLRKKFERFTAIATDRSKVKGDLRTKDLYAVIYEEHPGDLDPLVFLVTDAGMRLFIGITTPRSSGLEKDAGIATQFAEIGKHCDELKGK